MPHMISVNWNFFISFIRMFSTPDMFFFVCYFRKSNIFTDYDWCIPPTFFQCLYHFLPSTLTALYVALFVFPIRLLWTSPLGKWSHVDVEFWRQVRFGEIFTVNSKTHKNTFYIHRNNFYIHRDCRRICLCEIIDKTGGGESRKVYAWSRDEGPTCWHAKLTARYTRRQLLAFALPGYNCWWRWSP